MREHRRLVAAIFNDLSYHRLFNLVLILLTSLTVRQNRGLCLSAALVRKHFLNVKVIWASRRMVSYSQIICCKLTLVARFCACILSTLQVRLLYGIATSPSSSETSAPTSTGSCISLVTFEAFLRWGWATLIPFNQFAWTDSHLDLGLLWFRWTSFKGRLLRQMIGAMWVLCRVNNFCMSVNLWGHCLNTLVTSFTTSIVWVSRCFTSTFLRSCGRPTTNFKRWSIPTTALDRSSTETPSRLIVCGSWEPRSIIVASAPRAMSRALYHSNLRAKDRP